CEPSKKSKTTKGIIYDDVNDRFIDIKSIDAYEERNTILQTENKDLKEQLTKVQNDLQNKEEEFNELKRASQKSSDDHLLSLQNLKETLDTEVNKLNNFQEDLVQAKKHNQSLKEQLIKVQKDIQTKEEELNELKKANEKTLEDYNLTLQKLNVSQDDLAQIKNNNVLLKEQLVKVQNDVQSKEEELNELKMANEKALEVYDLTLQRLNDSQENLAQTKNDNELLKEQLVKSQKSKKIPKNIANEKALKASICKLNNSQKELSHVKRNTQKLQLEKSLLEKSIFNYQQALQSIKVELNRTKVQLSKKGLNNQIKKPAAEIAIYKIYDKLKEDELNIKLIYY
ncbi:12178_t:CDS:2, partial [Cetraspora pellucida]